MVKAKKTADPALKYYFEMLSLPLTASAKDVKTAYEYFAQEQAPGNYTPGSAEQKKAEERQTELKFAYEKLSKYLEENPDTNVAPDETFRVDGNAAQWKEQQAKHWERELQEFRAQEAEVWKEIQKQRKKLRLSAFVKRTKIMVTTVCALAFAGESWHTEWNKSFQRIQAQNLIEQVVPDFRYSQSMDDIEKTHEKLIEKANALRKEWDQDKKDSLTAAILTWLLLVAVALWWLPKEAWAEIKKEMQKLTKKAA